MVPRNANLWLPAWARRELTRSRPDSGARDVYVCVADHYEPYWDGADRDRARGLVRDWTSTYPRLAARHCDSAGKPPQHTFFYPEEDYDEAVLDMLADLSHRGLGDVELHLHLDHDTAASLAAKLDAFKRTLHDRHGLLRRDPVSGEIVYAFVHGNWALDNSRPDGRWCGVDNELAVLVETGCRVDMTMPSAPSCTQTRKVNSIYCAKGAPGRRKSHDLGRDVAVGDWRRRDELVLIQGPLTLNWAQPKFGFLPRIENGEISRDCQPTAQRVRLWSDVGVSVVGAGGHTIFNNILLSDVGSVAVEHVDFFSDNNIVRNVFSLDGESTVIKLSAWRAAGQGGASRKSTAGKVYRRPGARDYRLKGGSPAIDAGRQSLQGVEAPDSDIEGVARPQGASTDAGAYEATSSRSAHAGDVATDATSGLGGGP